MRASKSFLAAGKGPRARMWTAWEVAFVILGSNRQVLGAAVVLAAIAVVSVFLFLARQGREVEQGFTIVGGSGSSAGDAPGIPPTSAARVTSPFGAPLPTVPAEVVVHVAGQVRKPGVYHLPAGARADDAIRLAGGATERANTDAINLAARLEDGQQLYLPRRGEQPTAGASGSAAGGPARPVSAGPSAPRAATGERPAKLRTPGEGTVNVNTAGAAELERMPGVGPAMSARIIQYRKENGAFASADDLMNVSGIGPKKLEKMRPFVRIR